MNHDTSDRVVFYFKLKTHSNSLNIIIGVIQFFLT